QAREVPVGDVEKPHGPLVTRARSDRSAAPVAVVRLDLPVHVAPLRGCLEKRLEGGTRDGRVDVRLAADEADVKLPRLLVVADELDARRLDRDHPGRLAGATDVGIFTQGRLCQHGRALAAAPRE